MFVLPFKSGSAEGSCPLSGIGVSPKYLFSLLRRRRRRKKREKWGTAPHPRQGAVPLATPAKRCLTGFSKIRDDSYDTPKGGSAVNRVDQPNRYLSCYRRRFIVLWSHYLT